MISREDIRVAVEGRVMQHVREYANQQAIQQWEAHRQETKWIRDEVAELRKIVWCLIEASGGEIAVSDILERVLRDGEHQFSVVEDELNCRTIYRTREEQACERR